MQPPTKLETQHDRALVTNTWNTWGVVALMAEGKGLWQGGTWFIYIYIYLRGSSMTGSVCSFQAENCGGRWQ